MLYRKIGRTGKVWLISVVLLLSFLISGCQTEGQPPEKGDFACDLPEGFTLSDVTDKDCAILDSDGVVVGGIILTDLKVKDLRDPDSVALPQYLETIGEGSEYFSWTGGNRKHPTQYLTQSFTDPNTQEKREYYRIFSVKDAGVYDMWFDLAKIDEDTASRFSPIGEMVDGPAASPGSSGRRLQLSVVEAEEPGYHVILSREELGENSNVDITCCNLKEVNITLEGETVSLAEAIRAGKLSVPEIYAFARIDAENGFCKETCVSEHGLTHFTYTYPECVLELAYDVYETPNGKQTLIEEITIFAVADNTEAYSHDYAYVDQESQWGYFLDREDWGLTFTVSDTSPTRITLDYTQGRAQQVGELTVEQYAVYSRNADPELTDCLVWVTEDPENLPVSLQSDGRMALDWEGKAEALDPGEYYIRLTVRDNYEESEIHPLIVKYHDRQSYSIPFTVSR